MDIFQPNLKKIAEALLRSKKPTVAVVGDYCLDKYLYIDAALDEPSVETGLTAYQVRRKAIYPGAAGTIVNNLAALGARVKCFGLCGDDGEGFELLVALKRIGATTDGMIRSDAIFTNTYTKPMRMADDVATELNRLDIRNSAPAPAVLIERVKAKLDAAASDCDALVVSDQFTLEAGSVLNDDFRRFLSELAERHPNLFCLVDSRSFCDRYRGATVKCNASEILDAANRMSGSGNRIAVTVDSNADGKESAILSAGARLARRNGRPALVTRGKRGAILFDGGSTLAIPAFDVRGPIDICGAGDATNAALAFGRAIGLALPDAAFLAAAVSSITIEQIGVTGTATIEQVLERIDSFKPTAGMYISKRAAV